MATSNENESFQPGQLGVRHLLGTMVVVCVISGLSASQLRSMPLLKSAEVAGYWLLVAAIAGTIYYRGVVQRRSNRHAAGELLLRVLRKPISDGQRKSVAILLTAGVIASGVVMSVVLPNFYRIFLTALKGKDPFHASFSAVAAICWLFLGQGILWGACLDHWLTNVYWAEIRQNGLLTHGRYYPWADVEQIVWSPDKFGRLTVLTARYEQDMTIDPASRKAVTFVLEQIRERTGIPAKP